MLAVAELIMLNLEEKKGIESFYKRKLSVRLVAFAMGFLSAVLFSVALVRDFIPDKQIFEQGATLFRTTVYLNIFFGLACIAFCAFAIPKVKKNPDDKLYDAPEGYALEDSYRADKLGMKLCRYASAVLLLAQGCVRFYLFFSGALFSQANIIITAMSVALIFPLALYFVPEISQMTARGYKKVHLVYGSAGLFWFVCTIIYYYYDKSVAITSPYRLMYQIMLVAVLLAITEEIRCSTVIQAPRARLGTLCAAFIPTFGFTVGRIVMLACGKSCGLDDTVSIIIGLAFAVYFGARLFFYDER